MHTVKSALKSRIEITRTVYWLDNKTALCWIQNRGEWKQFLRHRVNEILHDWKHCPGEENVADIGSRGIGAKGISESDVWSHGPKWLSKGKDTWPLSESAVTYTTKSKVEEKGARSKVSPISSV